MFPNICCYFAAAAATISHANSTNKLPLLMQNDV
jgi:hypothetical protein